MKLERIDYNKYLPHYLSGHYYHDSTNKAKEPEKKQNEKDVCLVQDSGCIMEKSKPPLAQVKPVTVSSGNNETPKSASANLNPLFALEKLLSISANVEKRNQK